MSIFVDIEKKLGTFLLKVKFEAGDGVIALLGESGCGKSMTLQCIAGIRTPDKGKIVIDGEVVFDSEKKINLSPQKRRTGYLFQNYALFPTMTVFENIYAGANREKNKKKRIQTVQDAMERLRIWDLAERYPEQLSGGQQQRAALARILVSEPRILLLDEPFSALDSHLRFQMEQQMREVVEGFGKTVVFVSHDRDEAYRMSGDIAIMHEGKLEMIGSRAEVFAHPATMQSARMTGCQNISRAQKTDEACVEAIDWGIFLNAGNVGEDISCVGVRAQDICIGKGENAQLCFVAEEIENPFSYLLLLKPAASQGSQGLYMETEKHLWEKQRADSVWISIPQSKILLWK